MEEIRTQENAHKGLEWGKQNYPEIFLPSSLGLHFGKEDENDSELRNEASMGA